MQTQLKENDAVSQKKPQNYANHARFDPAFHYFVLPVFFITLIATIVHLVRHPHLGSAWAVVLALALIVLGVRARMFALKVQDRVIRLEERLRLATLLPETSRARIGELREPQLIALRFAPDAELPVLVERTLNENLTQKQIKQAIQNWHPDYLRV
jgi:hypothetical protein